MDRTWNGRIGNSGRPDHESFVAWLQSVDGQALLARSQLTNYRLAELGDRLTLTLGADEPPALIRFLRNRRFWPEVWEFESADPNAAVGPEATARVEWRRPVGVPRGAPQRSDD
jgi:hypothetical protein